MPDLNAFEILCSDFDSFSIFICAAIAVNKMDNKEPDDPPISSSKVDAISRIKEEKVAALEHFNAFNIPSPEFGKKCEEYTNFF